MSRSLQFTMCARTFHVMPTEIEAETRGLLPCNRDRKAADTVHPKSIVLKVTSLVEIGAGILLLVDPAFAVRLLLSADIAGAGIILSRVAGIALLALGVACWPSASPRQPILGMLTYSVLVMLYFILVGIGGSGGILLWPAVVVHAAFNVFLLMAVRDLR